VNPSHALYSPKASDSSLGKVVSDPSSSNKQQEGFSVSPRHMVFSMLKYPLTKKK